MDLILQPVTPTALETFLCRQRLFQRLINKGNKARVITSHSCTDDYI